MQFFDNLVICVAALMEPAVAELLAFFYLVSLYALSNSERMGSGAALSLSLLAIAIAIVMPV
jgi:hypothetical protein